MMKVVQINATCGVGSTGNISLGISRYLTAENIENYILYSDISNGYELGIKCSDHRYIRMQVLKSRILGNYGFNSEKATRRMIEELDAIQPDIVHLHNIHSHDCNLETLFKYFKSKKIKLFWTFHDCWAFTGYCTYFDAVKCDKWKTKCSRCVKWREQSWFFDKSSKLFERKKQLFEGLDLTIITPSQWLADLVKQSFLSEYQVKVINNGIDLSVFKPVCSDFRKKYDLENKKIVLGVSYGWDARKGIDVFAQLAERLSDEYKIVLVGIDEKTDKQLPDGILSIKCTRDRQELAEIYSAADIFVNPTREENYPTVNMEALACGTPVLTFRTGGSPEMLDETCAVVVECDDIDSLEREIIRICNDEPYNKEACVKKAEAFDENSKYKEYVEFYKKMK